MNCAVDIHARVSPNHFSEWACKHAPQSWHIFSALSDSMSVAPFEQTHPLFFDSLAFDSATLAHLTNILTHLNNTLDVGQFMLDTDSPFHFHQRRPIRVIRQCAFPTEQITALTQGNTGRFFRFTIKEEKV